MNEIFVTNNKNTSDTVSVENLQPGDVVKLYRDQSSTTSIGTATVAAGKTDVTINVGNLNVNSALVYVTVTSQGKQESARIEKDYSSEVLSDKLFEQEITVTNNPTIPDLVVVENLQTGDVVKVYKYGSTRVLGTAIASKGKTNVTVSIPQLGQAAGSINVTLTAAGCAESAPTIIDYDAELVTPKPNISNISVDNNPFPGDTVRVKNLEEGAVVKVYRKDGTKVIGIATVTLGNNEATVTVGQLREIAGDLDIAITNPGMAESERVSVHYVVEVKPKALALFPEDITVTNNAVIADTVIVDNLKTGDIIKVYDETKMLGTATVASGKDSATVTIRQLTTGAGQVYVTVTGLVTTESDVTAKDYIAEAVADKLTADDITITNNSGINDTVIVENLEVGDIIKVYNDGTKTKVLGTAIVAVGKTNTVVNVVQLGLDIGTVYITVTEYGKNESDTVPKTFVAEAKTDKPSVEDITVLNNVGISDAIKIESLAAGDIVKVYNNSTAGKMLGTTKVAVGKGEATVSIAQLGQMGGNVYISVTAAGKTESERAEISFDVESVSDEPFVEDVTVENNRLTADIVKVQNLSSGEIVKVYRDLAKSRLIGTATVASGKTEAVVNITQLGNNVDIYVAVTTPGKCESVAVKVNSGSEMLSDAPLKSDITTTNNAIIADNVKVINLEAGDIVKVYRELGTRAIGTATVDAAKTDAVVSLDQLGVESGFIFVTITSTGKSESGRTEIAFGEEGKTAQPSEDNITITNNVITADEINVDNLVEGDIVKVYKEDNSADYLAVGTLEQGKSSANLKVDQLEGASVWVTVTSKGKTESDRLEIIFNAENTTVTEAPLAEDIIVINNGIIADAVSVQNLTPGDIVKIYKDSELSEILGTATVESGKTDVTMSIAQLDTGAGTVYVKVISQGKTESTVVAKTYVAEATTVAPTAEDITVSNNSLTADIVKVENLDAGDIIKVYFSGDKTGKVLGVGVVGAGKTSITINIPQLGTESGTIYVTATTPGKLESLVTNKNVDSEAMTIKPLLEDINVTNNSNIADTVRVENLVAGDVVKVYDKDFKKVLGTTKVAAGKINAVISISQLGLDKGIIQVTVRTIGKLESDKTQIEFGKEDQTDQLSEDDIFITNNGVIADKVRVVNLSAGDIIKLYDESGRKLLGSATVAAGKTEATVSVTQLGGYGGTVCVSVKSLGKLESDKTSKDFIDETHSDTLSSNVIIITNNASVSDVVRVVNLTAGDIIKVYREETSTRILGMSTVAAGKTETTINIGQLGGLGGAVWISVIKTGKLESKRVEKSFMAEDTSTNLNDNQIIIIGK